MNEDDFKSDLPEGWALPSIRECVELKYGKGLPKRNRVKGSVRVYGSNGVVGFHNQAVTVGETIVIGRKGTVGAVHYSDSACWPIDTTYFIDEFYGLSQSYLTHALRYADLARLESSTAIPGLNRDDIYGQCFPLAPAPEQDRIAAKVEELLNCVDKAKKHLERVTAILDNFHKAVLNAACSGRLTKDWREKHGKCEPWKQVDFFDFCILQRGYDLPIKKCRPGSYPVVSSSGIAAFHCEFKAKGPGVTVGRSGSTGKVHYVEEDFWPHNTNLFVKDFKGNLPKYVYYFLLGFNFQRFSASTAVPTLNRNTLRGVKVKVPPVDEQVEIVRHVERLFDLANSIERRVKTATEKTEKLTQSILSKAFRGELVPTEDELARRQGRTYETAVQLLKRIKLEREKKRTIELKVEKIKVRSKVMGVLRGLKKRPILEVLSEAQGKLKPEELFRKANFTEENIDDFYEELRAAVQAGQIKESRPKKTEIYLEAVKT